MFYCFKCVCGRREERSLPMELRNEPWPCECGELMQRDKAAELRGSTPPAPELNAPRRQEKSMSERVRSGEFQLLKHFNERGGPKIFEN